MTLCLYFHHVHYNNNLGIFCFLPSRVGAFERSMFV